jgi:2-amino-4-hydroxy-6-hydroxymethyldihydropteridine diphosphokinase
MSWAVLGLGTNLGARRAILEGAIALLQPHVVARSALYATPPLGPPQPDYLNAAVRVLWDDEPLALLRRAHEIEALLGRERRERWGARTLDIDVLHWSEGPIASDGLKVPHPELTARNFALAPLLDVAPELSSHAGTLETLGGRPARALPGWSALVREGSELCGEWLHDQGELAAQFVGLWTVGAEPASAVRTFVGPAELLAGDAFSRILRDAWSDGFAVRGCAVLRRDTNETTGVLLGVPGVREAPPTTSPRLQQRADGAQRYVAARPASSWL